MAPHLLHPNAGDIGHPPFVPSSLSTCEAASVPKAMTYSSGCCNATAAVWELFQNYVCLLECWVILPNQVDNQQHSTSLRSCVWVLLKAFRNLQEISKGSQTCLSQHQETHTSKRCRKVVFSLVAYTVLGLAIQRTASGGRLLFNSNWGVAVLKSTTTGRLEGLIHSVLPT